MRRILLGLVLGALAITCNAVEAAPAERVYFEGYTGSTPTAPEDLAKNYFNRAEVRALISMLENGPLVEAEARRVLEGSKTTLSDLERLRLVSASNGRVRIAFAYFTAEDVRLIHRVAAKYVPSLVSSYSAERGKFVRALSRYPVTSVSVERLAFVLLAGFSLNWDALELLQAQRYRAPLLVEGPGWHYSFWASEDTPEYSYKGYYWGSSSFPAGSINLKPPLDFTYSSFGDAFSDPRMNFPDLFDIAPQDMPPSIAAAAQQLGLRDETELGLSLQNVIGLSRARDVGAVLFALRNGMSDGDRLCGVVQADAQDCRALLILLSANGYIAQTRDGHHELLVPVFDDGDKAMVTETLGISRKVIGAWLRKNYEPIRADLSHLTALRHGVGYPALFSQIWHELFGLATRDLVRAGFVEDPYATTAKWPGSIPVVWRTRIYDHDWQ